MMLQPLSEQLTHQLGLRSTPIGVQPVKARPAGVPVFGGRVPSSCTLWRIAEKGRFFAAAEAHHNCPIGTYTMGLPITDQVGATLKDFIGHMAGAAYLDPAEVAQIPRLEGEPAGFVYGPLGEFESAPTLTLLWATARQGMILEEALGAVAWTSARARITGRPACAALPLAARENGAIASLGCSGMRTFTEVSDDLSLVALPAAMLIDLPTRLHRVVESNEKMLAFYRAHKASFASELPG